MRIHMTQASLTLTLCLWACDASEDDPLGSDAGRVDTVDGSAEAPDATVPDASLADAGDGCGDPRGRDSTCQVYLIRTTPVPDEPCSFTLENEIRNPSYVFIQLDGAWIKSKDGYQLSDDGRELVLTGAACDQYRKPGEHTLTIQVTCVCVEQLP